MQLQTSQSGFAVKPVESCVCFLSYSRMGDYSKKALPEPFTSDFRNVMLNVVHSDLE